MEVKLNDLQDLFIQSCQTATKQHPVSLNLEIETLKSLLNEEETRLKFNRTAVEPITLIHN